MGAVGNSISNTVLSQRRRRGRPLCRRPAKRQLGRPLRQRRRRGSPICRRRIRVPVGSAGRARSGNLAGADGPFAASRCASTRATFLANPDQGARRAVTSRFGAAFGSDKSGDLLTSRSATRPHQRADAGACRRAAAGLRQHVPVAARRRATCGGVLSALRPIGSHPVGHRLLLFGRHRTALPRQRGVGRGLHDRGGCSRRPPRRGAPSRRSYSVTGCGTDFLQCKWAEMDRAAGEVAA